MSCEEAAHLASGYGRWQGVTDGRGQVRRIVGRWTGCPGRGAAVRHHRLYSLPQSDSQTRSRHYRLAHLGVGGGYGSTCNGNEETLGELICRHYINERGLSGSLAI